MKSLNASPLQNNNPKIFTPEILDWIEKEGFEIEKNDSYCDKLTDSPYKNRCFKKRIENTSGTNRIYAYIFSDGIGIDIDYDCGGNSSKDYWKFDDYNGFECTYDKMVDYVNNYIN